MGNACSYCKNGQVTNKLKLPSISYQCNLPLSAFCLGINFVKAPPTSLHWKSKLSEKKLILFCTTLILTVLNVLISLKNFKKHFNFAVCGSFSFQ